MNVQPPPRRVVMLVTNDVTTDSRVRKSALAVAATGAQVTVVGVSSDGRRSESRLGAVLIVRVPVDYVLRDHARALAQDRRRRGVPGLRPLTAGAERAVRFRAAALARDRPPGGELGWRERLGTDAVRVRRLVGRVGVDVGRAFWGGVDRGRAPVRVGVRWRQALPEVNDYELALGPVVDALRPDLVHAHDVQTLPIAARAVSRADAEGRKVLWLYDAHEWVRGLSQYPGRSRRVIAAWADLENEFIRSADRVITVSPSLAEALERRYDLDRTPDVVLNIPAAGSAGANASAGDVRTAAGVEAKTPLLVYSGGVTEARGVDTAVAALVEVPAAHLAVVAVPGPEAPAVRRLLAQAARLGVAERVHPLEPVAPDQVVPFLRSADVGLIPLRHYGSHEFALANKLFEYLHARLPMVVSDCRAQADFVTTLDVGLVHPADDPSALAARIREILAAPKTWERALDRAATRPEFTWAAQAAALQRVYEQLSDGEIRHQDLDPAAGREPGEIAAVPAPKGVTRLGIGPSNSAGQAWEWAVAVRDRWPETQTEVVAIVNGRYDYPADVTVDQKTYRTDPQWGLAMRERARASWTHALLETGRPLFGGFGGTDPRADIAFLRDGGVRVGLVFHGSEVRSPRRHAASHEFSPFTDPRDPYTRRLQEVVDRNLRLVDEFAGAVFVSTPDQLDDLPTATWLPVCVDLGAWPLTDAGNRVPLVVHAPSNPVLKGTDDVERAVAPLVAAGRITYRRVSGLQPADAAALIRSADIVIDQVLLGLYGVLACEALASGAVVLGNVGTALRSRVPAPVEIIEVTPATLAAELTRAVDQLPSLREEAAARRAFIERFHSGCYSADVLSGFLVRDGRDRQPRPEAS